MKKKTTWAASVVKKQLQTCCKHQTFSLETTERDDCTSQGFNSPLRVIHISSPIRETPDPLLQRRKSFNVLHGRSLLTTPEPLTPFRKSVESAIPLCRSSTFKSQRLQNVKSSPELPTAAAPATKRKVVLHKSGPLPVLQQLLRGQQGGLVASPLQVRKQLSGPLLGGRLPSPKQSAGPSPQPRISKVKFSPTPHDAVVANKVSAPATESEANLMTAIALVKVKKPITPRDSPGSKTECSPPPPAASSSPEFAVRGSTETVGELFGEQCGNMNVNEENGEKSPDYVTAAVVKIQAAYRGHQARIKLAIMRESSMPSEELEEEEEEEISAELTVEEAPSISTQMSRTDPQKQRRNPPPRVNKGWNGSLRSAQDHKALLRSRQEAALKRERAMEYALSRQRWRTRGPHKGWITDDRVPDKPGWVRNWLERATRMSNQNSQNRVFNNEFEPPMNPPESESLSMKSTVGMCTTDIGSVEVNLGWPLSLRQQHAAGLLQTAIPAPPPPPPPVHDPSPPPPRRSNAEANVKNHKFPEQFNEFSTSSEVVTSEESLRPKVEVRRHYRDHSDDRESVGSCEGPVLTKLLSPVVVATKPRLQQPHKASNSNSLKEAAKLREKAQALHPQSQVSVALSDGNSADTTAASVQRPTWR